MSSYLSDGSPTESVETGETTAYGKDAKTYVVGLRDSTLSLSGFFDGATDAVDEVFATALGTSDENITFAPEGLALGRRVVTMASLETSYEISSPVADVVSISMEAQTNDRLDRGVSLCDLASVAATGNGSSHNHGASSTGGATGTLHVTANSRNGNTTFKIQHSADNSVWVDLMTFSVVGATTKTSERKTVTGTVYGYTRVSYTCAGTSGSITFHASVARR